MRWWANLTRSNYRAGRRATQTVLAQSEKASDPAYDPIFPAYLVALKNIYENAMVDARDGYISGTANLYRQLNEACTKGIEVLQQLEKGLFDHLTTRVKRMKRKWLYTSGFIIGMLLLAFLDFAPTKLVFDSVFQYEPINSMFCSVSSIGDAVGGSGSGDPAAMNCLIDRNVILVSAIIGFLVAVVAMGHFTAVQVGGEYFEATRSALGWMLIGTTVGVIIVLTLVRYTHEVDVVDEKYDTYISDVKEQVDEAKLSGNAAQLRELTGQLRHDTSPEGKVEWYRAHRLRMLGNAALFTGFSLLIFIAAFFASLWHQHPDFDYFRRHRSLIRSRIKVTRNISLLEKHYNRFRNRLQEHRQSVQRELGEFFEGTESGVRRLNLSEEKHHALLDVCKKIQKRFSEVLAMPDGLDDPKRSIVPESERDWGETYKIFVENVVFFDAYEKGGLDGVNVRESNPDSILLRESMSLGRDHANAHPEINKDAVSAKYQAGYKEGERAREGVLSATTWNRTSVKG